MIRIAALASLAILLLPACAEARQLRATDPKPAPAARPKPAPAPPPWTDEDDGDDVDHDVDVEVYAPEIAIPAIPPIPPIPPLPSVRVPHVPGMIARGHSDRDKDADDDYTDVEEQDDDKGGKVRIFKLNRERFRERWSKMKDRFRHRMFGNGEDEEGFDSGAQARGRGSATLPVKGPVTFRMQAQGGDVEVTQSDRQQVSVRLDEAPSDEVALYAYGDRIEASFRGRRQLRRGKLRVELPSGSRVDLTSMSGDVSVQKLTGEVRIRTMSGDVKLAQVGKADVQTISGDAHIEEAGGPVRLRTVSGHGVVSTTGAAPRLEFQSASGNLDWSGVCGRDCHLSAETVSGDLHLAVDSRSSFELSYTAHSGELRDELNLTVKHTPKRKHGLSGGWLEATYGKGEGVIEADAFSGNLMLKKK